MNKKIRITIETLVDDVENKTHATQMFTNTIDKDITSALMMDLNQQLAESISTKADESLARLFKLMEEERVEREKLKVMTEIAAYTSFISTCAGSIERIKDITGGNFIPLTNKQAEDYEFRRWLDVNSQVDVARAKTALVKVGITIAVDLAYRTKNQSTIENVMREVGNYERKEVNHWLF